MRSVVGAIWPFLRPRADAVFLPDFFADFFATEPLAVEVFFVVLLCAPAELADTPNPAATSSARARCVAVRSFIMGWLRPGVSRATSLLCVARRDYAGQEDGVDTVTILTAQDFEDDIVAGLELGDGLAILVDGSDALAIHFHDDVVAAEV